MPLRPVYASLLNQVYIGAVTSNTFTGPQDLLVGTVAPAQAPLVIPANYWQAGMVVRMTAWGTFSTTVTPTLVFGPYLGTTALGVNVALTTASGAVTLPWKFTTVTICRATGGATIGSFSTAGELIYGTTLTAVTVIPIPGIANVAVAADTTTAATLSAKATYSSSSSSNIIVLNGFMVEELTPV